MTPAELITRRLKAAIEAAGATVPVRSPLLEALDGEKAEAPSSCIAVSVHVSGQSAEPLPLYSFTATASLAVAIDDDKGGGLFRENYGALWAAFDRLCRADNCAALGDEGDAAADGGACVFAVDGLQLGGGDPPDFQEDENGGVFTTSFTATVTGRA